MCPIPMRMTWMTSTANFLDDFAAVKVNAAPSTQPEAVASSSGPGRPPINAAAAASAFAETLKLGDNADADDEDVLNDEDFAKQLQDGMADLLGAMETTPEMAAQFESIFKELGAAAAAAASDLSPAEAASASAAASSTSRPSTSAGATSAANASFQETIRRTMERVQTSGEQATAAAAAEGSDDFIAELLKQIQAAGGGGLGGDGGEGNEEEFSKMLMGMMEQLTDKDILYVPMRELHDKFPEWLEKNAAATPADDLKRYEEQRALVKEIVAKFEEPTYSDANKPDREYIVDRMQKMQAAGLPPPDLVGNMPSGQDALSMPDESCNPQ
ncbi:Pex19 protein family-domain-containing protein [Bombardia bombarda]|uniref:Pex19 protein family-domain-containing protein n=1 Tax=Bombardia bombarda TaxID=252184 RepID=A0AA39XKT1_9PEZI|nr:Pex19 protein family-domain-containing protein [Bombardia bombarda]